MKKHIGSTLWQYLSLIAGIVAVVRGFFLLLDIAVGLILLFLGFTAINQWLMYKRYK